MMIFISDSNGLEQTFITDKFGTQTIYQCIRQPMAQRMGDEWLHELDSDFEYQRFIDLTELSADDFNFVFALLNKSAEHNVWLHNMLLETRQMFEADPRFKH